MYINVLSEKALFVTNNKRRIKWIYQREYKDLKSE